MTYPTAAVNTANADAGTDVPATFRTDVLDAIQKLNQMIAHTSAFAATLLDGVDAAAVRATLVAAASGGNADITSWSGGPLAGFRNRIINGNFGVNQRAYVSGAAVGASLYGHDRWKMAASGDTYTFSTTANVTTVTIPAGKVLRQVIEGLNLETGTYTLSWSGTAQGKIGAGAYGTSGITGSITGGTDTTIEFGPGTVSNVQLEFGSVATVFERRHFGTEELLCRRYFQYLIYAPGVVITTSRVNIFGQFAVPMRVTPSVNPSNSSGTWPTLRIEVGAGYAYQTTATGIYATYVTTHAYAMQVQDFPATLVVGQAAFLSNVLFLLAEL